MNDDSIELVPFHALNEFMRADYRLHVVRTVLSALPSLPANLRSAVDRQIKKHVRVQGFRSSDKAPARVKALPTAEAFEDHPELVAAVLEAWAEVNPALRQQIYDLLGERGWQLLPLDIQRSQMPGFFIHWPQSEEFEILQKEHRQHNPDSQASDDDISLMVVWVGVRLPFQIVEGDPAEVTSLGEYDSAEEEQEDAEDTQAPGEEQA
jgi:hypothetical protein